VAASLSLADGVKAFALGPRAEYARTVSRTVTRLEGERGAALRRLRAARTPGRQARAAAALSQAYGRAARSLEFRPSPLEAVVHAPMAKGSHALSRPTPRSTARRLVTPGAAELVQVAGE
jgi:hypothetical protein